MAASAVIARNPLEGDWVGGAAGVETGVSDGFFVVVSGAFVAVGVAKVGAGVRAGPGTVRRTLSMVPAA